MVERMAFFDGENGYENLLLYWVVYIHIYQGYNGVILPDIMDNSEI